MVERRRAVRAAVAEERAMLLAREQAARAEAVARAAERDALFEAMADGVFVCDRDGKLVRTNAAFRALLSIPLPLEDTYTSYTLAERGAQIVMRDEHGEPLPREQWPVARILRGETLTGGLVEVMVRAFDGRAVLLGVSGAPLYDVGGQVAGGVCVCRDMTERRRQEQRTHEALDALLMMAEALVHIEDGGLDTGEGGTTGTVAVARRLVALTRSILGCQRVSITGYDATTTASYPVAAVGLSDEEEQAWRSQQPGASLRDYLDGVQRARLQAENMLIVHAADIPGRALPYGVRTMLLALMRVGQSVVGVLSLDHGAVAHTYTPDEVALARAVAKLTGLVIERERLLRAHAEARANELALREANRRMDAFLDLASHELKTPLTVISGNIEVAERRLRRSAARDEPGTVELIPLLQRARHNLERLDRLVDDLLDMSQIQAGHLHVQLARCDLVAIVRDVVGEQQRLHPARDLCLRLPAAAHAPVWGDAARLGQVVFNYLTNALKYASPQRPIDVSVEVEGVHAHLRVRDEGPGLSATDQERVWDRFYRADGISHQLGSNVGLGLGLYISRTIIARHGGEAGVESAPGAGATFWFTLPLAQPEQPAMLHDEDC